jgi:hypothetical protein
VLSLSVLPCALRARNPEMIREFESGFERLGIPALLVQVVTGLWLAGHWAPDVAGWFSPATPANPVFRLRFHLSRPALDNAARTALSHEPLATPAWVGLFPVRRIDVFPLEVRFVSEGCGVIDECGLAYVPGPVPAGRSKTRLKHLGGPWYLLYSVF